MVDLCEHLDHCLAIRKLAKSFHQNAGFGVEMVDKVHQHAFERKMSMKLGTKFATR